MQITMTVGATKIQIIQENSLAVVEGRGLPAEVGKQQADDAGCEP